MKNLFNFFVTALGTIIALAIAYALFKMYIGDYFILSPINGAVLAVIGIAAISFIIIGLIKLNKPNDAFLALFFIAGCLSSCDYAKPNQQVLISSDCGVNWHLVDTGQLVPKGGMNYCFIKVAVPAGSMQGESKFIANFDFRVRATVELNFDYNIIDPILYVKSAKYLGRANSDSDDESNEVSVFEKLENKMIDSRAREAAKEIMLSEDASEYDQADLEEKILIAVNKLTNKIGIQVNYLGSSFTFEEQTAQAIDAVVAMKIYESKGMGDVGKQLMISKASATKITVEGTKVVSVPEE